MRVTAVELRQLEIPMIEPLAAAHGVTESRITILVRVFTDVGQGWGECVAMNEPTYAPEYSDGEYLVMKDLFIPALLRVGTFAAADVSEILRPFKQHNPAKAALVSAFLDAELGAQGISLAQYLGATAKSVECCAVVGLLEGDSLVRSVETRMKQGYRQLKLKIMPGRDVERVDLLLKHFPQLRVRVDANGSYNWDDAEHRAALMELDARGPALIEQPLPVERVRWYSEMRDAVAAPISLDESIWSLTSGINAVEMGMCDVIGVKPGLLGGVLVAKELHDYCQAGGVPTALGGMIETSVARAVNLALAALPGFAEIPSEIAPDLRWFDEYLTRESVHLVDGQIEVPTGVGLGIDVDTRMVERFTKRTVALSAND